MKLQEKRIFISDLPETATQDEIQSVFQNYGTVKSVEIKERKELGPKNSSLFFSYINIDIDDLSLQQCFKEFSEEKWHGQYVQLQLAKESFLDRLKRERQETGNTTATISEQKPSPVKTLVKPVSKVNGTKISSSESSESSDSSSESENEVLQSTEKISKPKQITIKNEPEIKNEKTTSESDNELNDLIIKSNKGKQLNKNGLKIESVGNKPILEIDLSKKRKATPNNSETNLKRLQAMNEMRKGHKSQKLLIAAALAKVDTKLSKVTFHDSENYTRTKINKPDLFDDEDDGDENYEENFNIKEQFEGKKGQQLLQLQSKFKNDKRFQLDKRFLDPDNDEENLELTMNGYNSDEMDLEEERNKQFEILGEVLGKPLPAKSNDVKQSNKHMLRFDPSQAEHSKYEIKNEDPPAKSKRKRKDLDNKTIEDSKPEVSKEVFYKVTDNLKDSLHEKQQFSLLSMFGKSNTSNDNEENTETTLIRPDVAEDKNPFRYDSSDDEDQTGDIPKSTEEVAPTERQQTKLWTEGFFFKEDDYRLQEGFDFIEKMKLDDRGEFTKIRRELKGIVRSKVRNNQRRDKPFKKKLGGNKKRKVLRIKKALKR